MTPRGLRAFLAVAEELHFGRAADRIGLTQPSLSQQIARLEAELGTALFERTSRRVRLTPAGAAFLPGARRTVIEVERAARAARDAATGGAGELVIGALGSALNGILPQLVHTFASSSPDVRIDIGQLDTADQLVSLQDRRLDIGFVRSAPPTPGLRITAVEAEPFLAVLASHHRLASETEIPLDALAGEPFVLWPRRASIGFYDEVIALCRRQGFSPMIRFEAAGAETLLGLIAAGLGVSIQPESYRNLGRAGVTFCPLADQAPISTLQVAHREGRLPPIVHRFLRIVEEHVAREKLPGAESPPRPS